MREDRVAPVAAEEGVDAGPPISVSSSPPPASRSSPCAAVEDVVRLLPAKLVVARPAVDRVGLRAAAQQRLVALAAGDDDRPEEVQPGPRLAAAVEVVVAAEQVHLELERAGRERDVEVAVAARGEPVLAGGEVVGPLGAVDDDAVGGVPERGGDLDLREVRLGGRAGAEEAARWSRVSVSVVPTAPAIAIESVLVVVAAPQGAGTAPNRSWPPETTSVACEPLATVAVTAFVPAS